MTLSRADKLPPQAEDIEMAVLGTILSYPDVINDISALLTPEMFYGQQHQVIFTSCMNVFKKINKIDLVTVTHDLIGNNTIETAGGVIYVTKLLDNAISNSMLEHHALIIKQKYIARNYIRIGQEIQKMAHDPMNDVSDIAEFAETQLLELSGTLHNKKSKKLDKIIDNVINVIEKIISGEIKLVGVPSGFSKLDRVTGGFKQKELTIIAARPSMGKTALALQIAKNAATLKYPVAFFSCEMGEDELGRRYLSGVSGRSNVELLNGKCNIDNLLRTSEQLIPLPLYIDDTSQISVLELRAKARRMVMEYGVRMVIVDYLQLMTGIGASREQEVASISRGLKGIAKDLDIAVVALSQLNRRLEATANKMPNLSDLRESGSIEQDADVVMFVYRPEYYKIAEIKINDEMTKTNGLMIVPIAKNRNGAVCDIHLRANECLSNIFEEPETF